MMRTPFNPTLEETEDWAYGQAQFYPEQDWDIIVFRDVTDDKLVDLVFRIAADNACPKQDSFIQFLYIMTASVIRSRGRRGIERPDVQKLEALIAWARSSDAELLRSWAQRSEEILIHPGSFNYYQ